MYTQDGTRNREFELSDALRSQDCLHSVMQATNKEQTGDLYVMNAPASLA